MIFVLQVDIDLETEPLGHGKDGRSVFLKDIWPTNEEIANVSNWPNLKTVKCDLSLSSRIGNIRSKYIGPSISSCLR